MDNVLFCFVRVVQSISEVIADALAHLMATYAFLKAYVAMRCASSSSPKNTASENTIALRVRLLDHLHLVPDQIQLLTRTAQ